MEQLRELRAALAPIHLDLWVVLYRRQLDLPVGAHLALCDKVTYWTWRADELAHVEDEFARVEELAPRCGKLLGCYLWDYATRRPMPLAALERHCELGLRWLHSGRIEGFIFLASCICDLELEAVEWARRWVAEVGGRPL
ncbi:MAG: hypothetical protein AB1716_09345 [Planctomycetota bacterium]